MGKRFSEATFVLLFLSILTLALMIAPLAKAENLSVTLNPSEGPAGTTVIVMISGFQASYPVSITFGSTSNIIGTIEIPYGEYEQSMEFTVPVVSLGTYTITATGTSGEVSTATFDVTQASQASATPSSTTPIGGSTGTSTGSSTGTPGVLGPTTIPVTTSGGFWSPLTITITSIVIAIAIFMTAVYVQRSRQKPLPYKEASRYEPRPSTPSTPSMRSTAPSKINQPYQPYQSSKINQPYQPSKINQPYQPYQPSKINQQATNIQQQPYTRVCRHCKRTVRDDLNICPYCSKRVK